MGEYTIYIEISGIRDSSVHQVKRLEIGLKKDDSLGLIIYDHRVIIDDHGL